MTSIKITKHPYAHTFGGAGFHNNDATMSHIMEDEHFHQYICKCYRETSPGFMRTFAGFDDWTKEAMDEFAAYYEQMQKAPVALDSTSAVYHKALQIIYESETPTFSCKDLAQKLSYSESYLRYVFKKVSGMSVQAKINHIRLEKAKRLFVSTRLSVTQIAFSLGFCDSNYFSAYFKKQTGKSPLSYRKASK